MRKLKRYALDFETLEQQCEAGRFNPARIMRYSIGKEKYIITLSAGNADDIDVYRDRQNNVFVLSRNYRMGYVGCEIFCGSELIDSFFASDDSYETEQLISRSPGFVIRSISEAHMYCLNQHWNKRP
jgi:hypothetical protein